ncbi:MAG: winged helix-turn-helix transcriptional regulator [Methanococci archaeon]|nr:winged helix-turn-helix transcriptional regulator [Methanococci archaeon]
MKKRNITEFQVLSEIIRKQPHIKQKEIAENLGVTVQAVSEHIRNLVKEGYVKSRGRGEYVVTEKGLRKLKNWISEFRDYLDEINTAVYRYKDIWPAIANEDIEDGEIVYLFMRRGLLYASKEPKGKAKAKVLYGGKKGEDISICEIKGIIDVPKGKVIVFRIPPEVVGGSRAVNYDLIKEIMNELDNYVIATMGTVAYVVASKLNVEPEIRFAVPEAIVNACNRGCNVIALITGKMAEKVIKKLDNSRISYTVLDATKEKEKRQNIKIN